MRSSSDARNAIPSQSFSYKRLHFAPARSKASTDTRLGAAGPQPREEDGHGSRQRRGGPRDSVVCTGSAGGLAGGGVQSFEATRCCPLPWLSL